MTYPSRLSPEPSCFVVIEKYFNDGSHQTTTKKLRTDFENLSETFVSDDDADTFSKPFPSYDEAFQYLTSRFYIELVAARSKNRIVKYHTMLHS